MSFTESIYPKPYTLAERVKGRLSQIAMAGALAVLLAVNAANGPKIEGSNPDDMYGAGLSGPTGTSKVLNAMYELAFNGNPSLLKEVPMDPPQTVEDPCAIIEERFPDRYDSTAAAVAAVIGSDPNLNSGEFDELIEGTRQYLDGVNVYTNKGDFLNTVCETLGSLAQEGHKVVIPTGELPRGWANDPQELMPVFG